MAAAEVLDILLVHHFSWIAQYCLVVPKTCKVCMHTFCTELINVFGGASPSRLGGPAGSKWIAAANHWHIECAAAARSMPVCSLRSIHIRFSRVQKQHAPIVISFMVDLRMHMAVVSFFHTMHEPPLPHAKRLLLLLPFPPATKTLPIIAGCSTFMFCCRCVRTCVGTTAKPCILYLHPVPAS